MELGTQIPSAVARWLSVAMTIGFAVAGAFEFISIGTRQANFWALWLAILPLTVWWEAARVRTRLGEGSANKILLAWATMQMMLWFLAMYAADLADDS